VREILQDLTQDSSFSLLLRTLIIIDSEYPISVLQSLRIC